MLVWAQVMAYRTDALKGAVPNGWTDFWDTKNSPAIAPDRHRAGGTPELEFALMAAGVPPDKLYPLDIDKAFASYDKIKGDVVKWWDTGAVPMQLLTDREVVLTSVWNGRMAAIQAAGVPAAISWHQGLLKRDCWAVPKNAPNKANAMKFIAFSTWRFRRRGCRCRSRTVRSTTSRLNTSPRSSWKYCRVHRQSGRS